MTGASPISGNHYAKTPSKQVAENQGFTPAFLGNGSFVLLFWGSPAHRGFASWPFWAFGFGD